MNIQTPAQAMSNRTARLVREARTPVYTSTSKVLGSAKRHQMAVEVDSVWGRHWTHMAEDKVDKFINNLPEGDELSDIDHSAKCWCQ
jgi:hypothetical protein